MPQVDLTLLERAVQRCTASPEVLTALRAMLDVVRRNTGRIDELERQVAALQAGTGGPGPGRSSPRKS